jgi:hypothetical protein
MTGSLTVRNTGDSSICTGEKGEGAPAFAKASAGKAGRRAQDAGIRDQVSLKSSLIFNYSSYYLFPAPHTANRIPF